MSKKRYKESVLGSRELLRNLKSMTYLELDEEMPTTETPRDNVELIWLREAILEVVSTLSDREKTVIMSRFFDEETLGEIADRWNVSSQKIKQIEAKALRKLKHPSRTKVLCHFLESAEAMREKQDREKEEEEKKERRRKEQALISRLARKKRNKELEIQELAERSVRMKKLVEQKKQKEKELVKLRIKQELRHKKKYHFYNEVQEMITSVERKKDIRLSTRLFVGKCACMGGSREWYAEYRLLCNKFEVGCMECLTKFHMEVKE